jgi:plastocyanin
MNVIFSAARGPAAPMAAPGSRWRAHRLVARLLGPLTAALALTLPGCGGTVKTPTESAGGSQATVQASDFVFTPANLTVRAGTTVTWTNAGGFHNVTADDGSFRCSNGCDDTGGHGDPSTAAWSFARTFNSPTIVHYHCQVHGAAGGVGMSGTITVTAAP